MGRRGICSCIPARVSLAILYATGVMELYMTRTNLSIAIVAMVYTVNSDSVGPVAPKVPYCLREDTILFTNTDETLNNSINTEYRIANTTEMLKDIPPIQMTSTQRGNVLSAFFYVYGIGSLLGGRLGELYGTKKVFGIAVMIDAVGNLLIPKAAKTHYGILFAIRLIMGFFQGMCYPAMTSSLSKWIPKDEISRFIGFSYTANSFGTIFTLTICGIIISEFGWEYVFYISGCISFIWVIFWSFLMFDSPEEHPRITPEEKAYILQALAKDWETDKKPKKIPWCDILKSIPIWAINIVHAGNMFGLSFLITQLPLYMSSIIGVNIRRNGLLSALPFLGRFCGSNAFSWISNYLMKKWNWSLRTWYIILTVIGTGGPALSLILVGYVGCRSMAVLILFTVGMFLNGSNIAGYGTNNLVLSPNFAGSISGYSSFIGFNYAMIAPVIVGALTPNETINEYITVYWMVFVSYTVTATFYCIFMGTTVQPWNSAKQNSVEVKTIEAGQETTFNNCTSSDNEQKCTDIKSEVKNNLNSS